MGIQVKLAAQFVNKAKQLTIARELSAHGVEAVLQMRMPRRPAAPRCLDAAQRELRMRALPRSDVHAFFFAGPLSLFEPRCTTL